ncbi:phasin family protein [Methylobacterium gossipiicola]|uniref:Phasin family protein n=1 Tax=Methylobacterium gossipiicola TaxID=582675 RepID=A0A1I2QMJ6_9HYPH|nr:phasin family protein [Methylobacterium gossipiicola]SFG29604.1 phasin family protein [Methylobacterium gossipiicola]
MISMTQAFKNVVPFAPTGKTGFDSVMKGFSAVAKTNQTAGIEWADFARQSFTEGQAALKQLAAARTPQAAFEIQTAYLKRATERLMAQAQVLKDLYAGLASDMAKPRGASV